MGDLIDEWPQVAAMRVLGTIEPLPVQEHTGASRRASSLYRSTFRQPHGVSAGR